VSGGYGNCRKINKQKKRYNEKDISVILMCCLISVCETRESPLKDKKEENPMTVPVKPITVVKVNIVERIIIQTLLSASLFVNICFAKALWCRECKLNVIPNIPVVRIFIMEAVLCSSLLLNVYLLMAGQFVTICAAR
jgi:hypothetical protein